MFDISYNIFIYISNRFGISRQAAELIVLPLRVLILNPIFRLKSGPRFLRRSRPRRPASLSVRR